MARSLFKGFSLAANAYVIHNPQDNDQLLAGTWLGAEWVLVPFLKTDEGNFGAQVVVGAEHHDDVLPNVLDLKSYDYMNDESLESPLAQFFGGSAFSEVTSWSWAALAYVCGNSLLRPQEQRWN